MKNNLFEILLNLFEKSLDQTHPGLLSDDPALLADSLDDETVLMDYDALHLNSQRPESIRVFTYDERMRLSTASYRLLMQIRLWEILDDDCFEEIMTQLHSSDSHIITLQETKWVIRSTLALELNEEQLSFLDLVLYQKEHFYTAH